MSHAQQKTQSKSMRLTAMIVIWNASLNHDVLYNALCAAGSSVKSWDSALTQC